MNQVAPEGSRYVCAVCGKWSRDSYGSTVERSRGWGESCMLNCFLASDDDLIWRNGEVGSRVVDTWSAFRRRAEKFVEDIKASAPDGDAS